jgi:hypothetical protein
MPPKLESPWKEFLEELDSLLTEPLELHCIGGFAILAAYGYKRITNDLDYFTLVPIDVVNRLHKLAGQGSALARKHKVHVQHVPVASLPEDYETRIAPLFPGHFKNIRLFVLDPYGLILSKLSRNADRDREDVAFLAKSLSLDKEVLRGRYERELRPSVIGPVERHDATLEMWVQAYWHES